MNNYKPFDLEKAKAGEPVITRDGRDARILCFDRKTNDDFTVVALITNRYGEEVCTTHSKAGVFWENAESNDDLFMKPKIEKYYFATMQILGFDRHLGVQVTTPQSSKSKLEDVVNKLEGIGTYKLIEIFEREIELREN